MNDLVQLLTKYVATCPTKYVATYMTLSDAYLIFHWYFTGWTQSQRMKESTKEQHPQVSLTITENKLQIITILCQSLVLHFQDEHFEHGLVITGSDQNPNEVQNEIHINRHDMTVSHEEGDVIIIDQAIPLSKQGSSIYVECDGTDVFALLVHFYDTEKLTGEIFTIPTNRSWPLVSQCRSTRILLHTFCPCMP